MKVRFNIFRRTYWFSVSTVLRTTLGALMIALCALGALQVVGVRAGSTIVVTTSADELNSDGDCSLREAIQAANTNTVVDNCVAGATGSDTVVLSSAKYVLTVFGDGENFNATGDLDILEDLVIDGAGLGDTLIQGDTGWDDRILHAASGVNLTINGAEVWFGNVNGNGGGILHMGNLLQLTDVRVSDNRAVWFGGGIYLGSGSGALLDNVMVSGNTCTDPTCDGGGMYVLGIAAINSSTFSQNDAEDAGGGLHVADAPGASAALTDVVIRDGRASHGGGIYSAADLTLERVTVSGNSADQHVSGYGGGIYVFTMGLAEMMNVTVSGNDARGSGGGLSLSGTGTIKMNNMTITANNADSDGGGSAFGGGVFIEASTSSVQIANTILAENELNGVVNADASDCHNAGGTLTSYGHNLQGVQSTHDDCDFSYFDDMQGTPASPIDPMLGPLVDNGGPTRTHALLFGSPALGRGYFGTPGGPWPACEAEDQRGVSRPVGIYCDIGAYEYEAKAFTANVTRFDDPAPDSCDSGVDCSLREAVIGANFAPGATLSLPPGTYNLGITGKSEDYAFTGDLDLRSEMTIQGNTSTDTIINATEIDRVFHVWSSDLVTINDVMITDGYLDGTGENGGGVLVEASGVVEIYDAAVTANTAVNGGGIFNAGSLILNGSTVDWNTGSLGYAGLWNQGTAVIENYSAINDNLGQGVINALGGTMTITNSQVNSNDTTGLQNDSSSLIVTASELSGNGGRGLNSSPNMYSTTVESCTINNNSGGGIHLYGEFSITDTTISGNGPVDYGAGIIFNNAYGVIDSSTISGNTALVAGGGIRFARTSMSIVNSTISGNSSNGDGGGIHNYDAGTAGTMNLSNVTITDNVANADAAGGGDGGGIYHSAINTINVKNSIIAGNSDLSTVGTITPDCFGDLTSLGYNLIGVVDGSGWCTVSGDTTGNKTGNDTTPLNPRLDALDDNGGNTATHDLLKGSPAANAGNPAGCTDQLGAPITLDQRGEWRPYGAACDMGALEYMMPAPADFDGNYLSDVVVFRAGAWRFFNYGSGTFDHGVWTGTFPGCIPAPMDYNGDGGVEFTQLCSGAWHFYNDNGTYNKGIWTGGVAGDLPVPADYDADGTDDVVIWRAGAWRFFDFATASFDHGVWTGSPPHWLGGTNIPVPMDYDGDGAAEFTVWSGGPWHFYNDDGSYNKGIWTGGVAGDMPVAADYDGDSTEEVVVWRAGAWRFFDFDTALFDHGVWTGAPPHWLGGTSLPAPLDYDGDGFVEFTVWSGGPWHFYNDIGGYLKGIWTGGVAGDLPISRRLLP